MLRSNRNMLRYKNQSHIERLLDEIEAALILRGPKRLDPGYTIFLHEAKDKERALAEMTSRGESAGRRIYWSGCPEDEAAAKAEAIAAHVARHPEDAGLTAKDYDWRFWCWVIVHDYVYMPKGWQPGDPVADAVAPAPEPAPVEASEPEPAPEAPLAPEDEDAIAGTDRAAWAPNVVKMPERSKPWRPVRQRPAPDQRRPTEEN
jgi:hypothetical protein